MQFEFWVQLVSTVCTLCALCKVCAWYMVHGTLNWHAVYVVWEVCRKRRGGFHSLDIYCSYWMSIHLYTLWQCGECVQLCWMCRVYLVIEFGAVWVGCTLCVLSTWMCNVLKFKWVFIVYAIHSLYSVWLECLLCLICIVCVWCTMCEIYIVWAVCALCVLFTICVLCIVLI